MKRFLAFLAAILICTLLLSQSPENMSYQAVIRDNSNHLVVSSPVGMQISILQNSPTGSIVYRETHTPTTNANGLVTIEIGGGTEMEGDLSAIDWGTGTYYIKTDTDPGGGTSYSITGTSQLLSVPYSLYSNISGQLSIGDTWLKNGSNLYFNDGKVGIGTNDPLQKLHIQGTAPFLGTGIVTDGNDRTTFLLTGGFPNLIIGSNGNDNHGATLGFWNYDNDVTTYQWNMGGGQDGNFSIGFATNSTNPHCGIDGFTVDCSNPMTPLLINTDGYVGINRINPQHQLDVNGDARVTGNLTVDGDLDIDINSIINDILPAGMIVPFAGDAGSVPQGWLLCDGLAVSRTSYQRLYNAIGINYGYGDGSSTFNLPDFRGRFLRGVDNGAGRDPNAGSRTASNTGGNTGDAVGSWQAYATSLPTSSFSISAEGNHIHSGSVVPDGSHIHGGVIGLAGGHSHSLYTESSQLYLGAPMGNGSGAFFTVSTGGGPALATNSTGSHLHSITIVSAGTHSHTLSIVTAGSHSHTLSGGDNETRPQNVSVNYIIKY